MFGCNTTNLCTANPKVLSVDMMKNAVIQKPKKTLRRT
jgi:hypothetical protein